MDRIPPLVLGLGLILFSITSCQPDCDVSDRLELIETELDAINLELEQPKRKRRKREKFQTYWGF